MMVVCGPGQVGDMGFSSRLRSCLPQTSRLWWGVAVQAAYILYGSGLRGGVRRWQESGEMSELGREDQAGEEKEAEVSPCSKIHFMQDYPGPDLPATLPFELIQ